MSLSNFTLVFISSKFWRVLADAEPKFWFSSSNLSKSLEKLYSCNECYKNVATVGHDMLDSKKIYNKSLRHKPIKILKQTRYPHTKFSSNRKMKKLAALLSSQFVWRKNYVANCFIHIAQNEGRKVEHSAYLLSLGLILYLSKRFLKGFLNLQSTNRKKRLQAISIYHKWLNFTIAPRLSCSHAINSIKTARRKNRPNRNLPSQFLLVWQRCHPDFQGCRSIFRKQQKLSPSLD